MADIKDHKSRSNPFILRGVSKVLPDLPQALKRSVRITKKALIIGCNYIGTKNELKGCINDAVNMKKLLIGKFGYLDSNITLMTDLTLIKPTKSNIIKYLSQLVTDVDEPTILYMHYSGHGLVNNGNEADRLDGKIESICPLDFQTNGVIYDTQLRQIVDMVQPNCSFTASMDCCYSEDNFNLLWNVRINSSQQTTLSKICSCKETQGHVTIISACQDTQQDADLSLTVGSLKQKSGALSAAIISVLKNSDNPTNGDLLLGVASFFSRNNLISGQSPCISFGKGSKGLSDLFVI